MSHSLFSRCAAAVLTAALTFVMSGGTTRAGDTNPRILSPASRAGEGRPSFFAARTPRRAPANYKLLYSFAGSSDGAYPIASLLFANNALYGTTTYGGGMGSCSGLFPYCGTVFKITTSGQESVVHSFGGGSDGSVPVAGLIESSGALYGTTSEGGGMGCDAVGCGTVFKISSGEESVLYSFAGPPDGADPYFGNLFGIVNKMAYGTTAAGGGTGCGGSGCGTIFKVTTSGKESVLYSFKGGSDGSEPLYGLTSVKNNEFVGTTNAGGGTGCYEHQGCGTVYKVNAAGKESVLHRFRGGMDGAAPSTPVSVAGTLYGTTLEGGGKGCAFGPGFEGCGTVYKITTSGKESVIYRFTGGNDGGLPNGGLIVVNGNLYGTASEGGTAGYGTVFSITTSGVLSVLYSFLGSSDGAEPDAGVIEVNGTLYGTTSSGGGTGCDGLGCGTVFSIQL